MPAPTASKKYYAPVVTALLVTTLIAACSDETDPELLAPTVAITTGPVEGSTV